MNCEEVKLWMQYELDRELPEPDQVRLRDHLKQCPECAALFDRLQSITSELEQLPKVLPPFSIVDSILPALAELTPEHTLPMAANVGSSTEAGSVGRARAASWFSWKLSAGVAAAALVASIFLFHFGTPRLNSAEDFAKSADTLRAGGAANRSAASSQAARPSGAQAMGADQKKSSVMNHSETGTAPSPDDKRPQVLFNKGIESGQDSSPTPTPSIDDSKESQSDLRREGQPVSPTTSGQMKFMYNSNSLPSSEPTLAPETTPNKEKALQPAATPLPTEVEHATNVTASPDPGAQPQQGIADTPAATPSGPSVSAAQSTIQPQGIAALPAPTPSTAVSSAPYHSFAAMRQPAKSAEFRDGHVVVLDANGNVVFQSVNTWLSTDSITFDWRSDTLLAYTVVRNGQPNIVYVIDLTKQTEQTELK